MFDPLLHDVDATTTHTNTPGDEVALAREILENTQAHIQKALAVLRTSDPVLIDQQALLESLALARTASRGQGSVTTAKTAAPVETIEGDDRVVEGVFNGEKMVGADGRIYAVAPNYASKSKLVEGDMLKLTIAPNGSFIYKQIGPIARQQSVAALVKHEATNSWYAVADGGNGGASGRWRLLTAAVTYFHGQSGDDVVILTPERSSSTWAAVENIIKRT